MDGAPEAPAKAEPLPVATVSVHVVDGHVESRRFTGTVRSRQASGLGFERGGKVAFVAVEEGATVSAGDVLARLDVAQLRAARRTVRAGLAEAQAQRDLSTVTAKRVARLAEESFAPAQDADEARFGRDAAQARVEALEARLAQISVDLEQSVLRAPFGGLVSDRLVDEGMVVSAGTPVVRLLHGAGKEAFVGVPVELASTFELGSAREVELGSRASSVTGRVTGRVDDVDRRTRTVGVVLALPPGAEATDGELATLLLERRAPGRGAWLPLTALEAGLSGLWAVARVASAEDGSDVVVREVVEVQHVEGDRVFVTGTLSEGDRVVARGLHRVVPGQRVRDIGEVR